MKCFTRHWVPVCLFVLAGGCAEEQAAEEDGSPPEFTAADNDDLTCHAFPQASSKAFVEEPLWVADRVTAPRRIEGAEVPPRAGAMVRAGEQLLVADPDNSTLVVIDLPDLTVRHTFAIDGRPHRVIALPDGSAVVALKEAEALARLANPLDHASRIDLLHVGGPPVGLAARAGGGTLYAAVATLDRVAIIDLASWSVIGNIDTLDQPHSLAITRSGALVVAHRFDELLITGLDEVAGVVALRRVNPGDLTVDPSSADRLVPGGAADLVVDPETDEVYVAHTIADPDPPGQFTAAAYYTLPQPINVMTTVPGHQATVTRVNVAGVFAHPAEAGESVETLSRAMTQPSSITHHPLWSVAFVTGLGTDRVLILNTAHPDPMREPIGEILVRRAPTASAVSADGRTLYVMNAHSYVVTGIDLPEVVPAQPSTMRPLRLTPSREVAYGDDPLDPEISLGRRLFTFSLDQRISGSGFACATCHVEGGEDKLAWRLPEGSRQTPVLAHRLSDTGPFNWQGTQTHLVGNFARTIQRMNGSGIPCHELLALKRFILEGLPAAPSNPHVAPDGLTPSQERGRTLFNDPSVGCAGCHAGEALTDGRQHNNVVPGTGEAIDTPSLRGLWSTAPYLHDGSAANLFDVLEKTSGTMGNVSRLSPDDRSDLVSYLLTL